MRTDPTNALLTDPQELAHTDTILMHCSVFTSVPVVTRSYLKNRLCVCVQYCTAQYAATVLTAAHWYDGCTVHTDHWQISGPVVGG
jgi:hypothetical protein